MIERKLWVQCEACQNSMIVSSKEKGKSIFCSQCNNTCNIPDIEAIPAEKNEEYDKKNRNLENNFYSVCPNCHSHYNLLRVMNNQEMLCPNCHTIFIPSITTREVSGRVYTNTRNDPSITLCEKLKKSKIGHKLQGGLATCFELAKIAKNDSKGNLMKLYWDSKFRSGDGISLPIFLTNLIFYGMSSNILSKYSSNISALLSSLLIAYVFLFLAFAFADGSLIYFRNIRGHSETIANFYACFTNSSGLKLEFLKTTYVFSIILLFFIPAIFLNNSLSIVLTILGSLIASYRCITSTFSIYYLMDGKYENEWQCIKQSEKDIQDNFFYILGTYVIIMLKFLLLIGAIILFVVYFMSSELMLFILIPVFMFAYILSLQFTLQVNTVCAICYEIIQD